jgi:methyl-accepting chemotaxis protein
MQINPLRRFAELKVGPRLALSYGVILMLVLIALTYIGLSMRAIDEHTTAVIDDDFQKVVLLSNINDSVATVVRVMRTVILLRNDQAKALIERKKIDEARKEYGDAFKELEAMQQDEFGQAQLPKIREKLTLAREIDNRILSLSDQGKPEEATALLLDKGIPILDDWKGSIDEYHDHQTEKAEKRKLAIEKEMKLTTIVSTSISIITLLLGVFAAVFMTRSITNPLHLMQKAINDVQQGSDMGALASIDSKDEFGEMGFAVNQLLYAQISAREQSEAENDKLNNSVISLLQAVDKLSRKDLTARALVTQDIIGTVSDSINQLTDETSKVLRGVTLIAGQVAEASGKVQIQGELVSKTAEEERKDVGEMVRSLGEATQSMNEVGKLADQSNRSAERATLATDSALATVNSTVKGMDSIRETIAETEKRIKRLGERSQEISGIVNLINTISERTHVLALNASMQAAVAGEAGRGFAVVAEEVQRLAESSRNATQQISTLVNNIQLETNETISTVNRTIGQVVQGSEQALKASEQMRLTQGITGELVEQVRHIAEASEKQKELSAQLLESVQRLGQGNARTAQQIDAQSQETRTLLDSAHQLVESVSVFTLPKLV